jgi:hypothetical protein
MARFSGLLSCEELDDFVAISDINLSETYYYLCVIYIPMYGDLRHLREHLY